MAGNRVEAGKGEDRFRSPPLLVSRREAPSQRCGDEEESKPGCPSVPFLPLATFFAFTFRAARHLISLIII